MVHKNQLTINEDTMLQIIVKLEMYMQLRRDTKQIDCGYTMEIQKLHDELEAIWLQMIDNEDYVLIRKDELPF